MDMWTYIIQSVAAFAVRHGCQYFMNDLRIDGWGLGRMSLFWIDDGQMDGWTDIIQSVTDGWFR